MSWKSFTPHSSTRACLKIHSRHPYAPLCGRFAPYSVAVARYSALMRNKSPISYPWVQIVTHGWHKAIFKNHHSITNVWPQLAKRIKSFTKYQKLVIKTAWRGDLPPIGVTAVKFVVEKSMWMTCNMLNKGAGRWALITRPGVISS